MALKMVTHRVLVLCVTAVLCGSPTLFAQQTLFYQLSIPAVTTGPVQTAAVSLQYIAATTFPLAPPAPPVNLMQQPGFALTGSPQPGYVLSSALFFYGGPSTSFSLTFQNSAGLQIQFNLSDSPPPFPPQPPVVFAPGTYSYQGSNASYIPDGGSLTLGFGYIATLTVTSAAPAPTLTKNPSTLTFVYNSGGTLPGPQQVLLSSSSALTFSAIANVPWLNVVASSSNTPATLLVTVNPANLAAGTYSGSIQLSAPGASNSSDTIPVTLIIAAPYVPPPFPYQISNSASYAPANAPNGGIAQGSLFVIFGQGLGPATLAQSGYPLSATLAGTSVKVTVGFTSTDALILYTSIGQVAAILPSRTATGTGTLVVTYNGTAGSSIPITVVPSSFGTYSVASNGLGPGIITGADYGLKTFASPARPGDTLILWGTGLGAITGDESNPPTPANLFSPQVLVGDATPAKVTYAGRSSCCSGLDQINFVVPADVEGCFVPVSVESGGVNSNFTSLPIASSGSCSQPPGFSSSLVTSATQGSNVKIGILAVGPVPILRFFGFGTYFNQIVAQQVSAILGRKIDSSDVQALLRAQFGTPAEQRSAIAQMMKKYGVRSASQARKAGSQLRALLGDDSEGAIAAFGGFSGVGSFLSQFLTDVPPSGTCTTFQNLPTSGPGATASPGGLDAGAQLSLSSPVGTKTLAEGRTGEYAVFLGSGFTPSQAPVGTYRFSGSGGKDIGNFSASLNATNSLTWLNQSAIGIVDRTQPLTITYSGGPNPGHVFFGGFADASGGSPFLCVADAQAGTLTVPPEILSILPPTTAQRGYLFLAADPFENPFTAPGLDAGYFMNFSNDSREVQFK
jgi:uncharacterized protein (TIGR03437 family)